MISVGIDVSKGKSTVCILKPYGEIVCSPFEVQHTDTELNSLHEKLRQMKIKYEPKLREDSDWSLLFSLAVKDFTYVDYLYDFCMFEATEDELKKEYEEIVKELKKIEKRINDTESGAGGSDVRQIGEGLAV